MSLWQQTEPQQGYNVGNLKELDARFKCTYCHLVLRDPMQGDCGHRYCKNCVQLKFKEAERQQRESLCTACGPEDEQAEISPSRSYPDAAINREINKTLTVLCPNAPCDKSMLLGELDGHTASCGFKPKPCDLCGQVFPAADLLDHADNNCPRRSVPCDVCKEPVVSELLEEHRSSACIGSTVQCEYCQARVKDDDKVMDSHWRSECPVGWHDSSACPYGCAEMPEGWEEHRRACSSTHLDRLWAKLVPRQPEDGKEAPEAPGPLALAVVAARAPSTREVARVAPSALAADVAIPGSVDYEKLSSLIERARGVEQRLGEVRSSATGGDLDEAQRKNVVDDLEKLQAVVSQGERLGEILVVIRGQLEQNLDKIRAFELQMVKGAERKLDMERKTQDLNKLLAYKEMRIADLARRVDILEVAGYDGTLLWKITDVKRRREDAINGRACSIYSPPFHTSKYGYKMCARLYLNGDGAAVGTHISLFFIIMRGAFDALLPWPFANKVTMTLIDQNFDDHVTQTFKPDAASPMFRRPAAELNPGAGFPLFAALGAFESGGRGYVKDDTMFIKLTVDRNDLPA